MSEDSSSKREVLLMVESTSPLATDAHIYAVDAKTGERLEVRGVKQATICLSPHAPTSVHLEVIPERVNVAAILEQVEDVNA